MTSMAPPDSMASRRAFSALAGRSAFQLQLPDARVALGQFAAMPFTVQAALPLQPGTFAIEPFQTAQIRRLTGADLVRQHVDIGIYRLPAVLAAGLVGQRRPHRPGHLALLQMLLPERAHFGFAARLVEAPQV
jgi:hypothetical protein